MANDTAGERVNADINRYYQLLGCATNGPGSYFSKMLSDLKAEQRRQELLHALGFGIAVGVFSFLVFLWLMIAGMPPQ